MNLNKRLLDFARGSHFWLLATLGSGFLAGILTIGQAFLISQIVNQVFMEAKSLPQVQGLLSWTLVLIFCRFFLDWLTQGSAETIAVRVKEKVRAMLLAHVERLGPPYTVKGRAGELTNTLVEGVEALHAYFSQYLPQLILSALVPLSILVFVFPLDPLSGLILLVTAPLIPFFMLLIGRTAQTITDRQYQTMSRLAAQFLEALQGLTTLKIFGQAKARTETIAETSDQFRMATMKVLRVTFLSAFVLELLATLSTALVAVEIGLRLLYARISFQEAFFLLIIAPEFYLPLRHLGLRFHAGMEGVSAAQRIFEILDAEPVVSQPAQPVPPPQPSFSEIRFQGIHFSYPTEGIPILRELDFSLAKGEQIALVGATGSGKSTLAQLLLGFYSPDDGQILIDKRPLQTLDIETWRAQIAWVPQEPMLFHDTVAANIRLANPSASLKAIREAAQAAHLDEVVSALPQGYQTVIGEGGARLSSGQAQRLAIARAFLKDAPLLLLDEPTSQLDPETEGLLERVTRRLMAGRTVLTIAHRLGTIYRADRILVLKKGTIVEKGNHRDLQETGGTYRDLVRAYTGIGGGVSLSPTPLASDLRKANSPPSRVDQKGSTRQKGIDAGTQRKTSPLSIFQRLLAFVKPYRKRVFLSVLLGALTIASSVGLLGTSAWLITTAALQPPLARLNMAIVGVRFFGIARGVLRYFERLISHDVTFRVLTRIRVWLYKTLEPLAPARLMTYRAGDLLSSLISDVELLEKFYVRTVAPPLVALLIGTGTSFYLGSYAPILGLILLVFFIAVGLGIPLLTHHLSRIPGQTLVRKMAELQYQLVDFIQGLPDLKAFGQAASKREEINSTGHIYGHIQKQLGWIRGLDQGLSRFFTNLGTWAILLAAIPMVTQGQLSGVLLATIFMTAWAAFEAVQSLPHAARILSSSLQAGGRLFHIAAEKPAVVDPPRPEPVPKSFGISIQGLHFSYPGLDSLTLEDLSIEVKQGEKVALVGPSGAGKSTLAYLLLRFWDDKTESIRLIPVGKAINAFAQHEIRESLSVVSQDPYFFHDTIQANLKIAKADATEQEIITAAQRAGIHTLISGFPRGYETIIGERGARLSGGERQRLVIARALLKDGTLFLLDELTANLDPLTERKILDNLFQALEQKTLLMITHRLVGLDDMDQIIVLEDGKIVERGTHQELLDQTGTYRRMWDIQNRLIAYG
jgi:ATP-binding cassette subfamily C protein CydCD